MKLSIYLADLTHIGNGNTVATEAFPLNIGLIASHALQKFGDSIEIELFKYPNDLLEAIKKKAPDILGCSNYTWNANLSYFFTQKVKKLSPHTLTVWGGTNYPFQSGPQKRFLHQRRDIDLHIYYEGEQAFSGIVQRVLDAKKPTDILNEPIDSCQFIHPKTEQFISGLQLPRIKKLDETPSPYVTGLLDKFFDGILTPLVETARGCPFKCNFCNAGESYYNKVNKFSDEYVEEELTYIAKMASKTSIGHVTFADNNYGMIPRDELTTKVVHGLREKYDWPKTMTVWTGKNAKERVINVTRLLQDTIQISMSAQSMDPKVQKNIKRDNINIDHFRAIAEELDNQGRRQHAELIMPLPGETLDSHIKGMNELLDTKIGNVLSHTLQMLHGTPYKDDPAYVKKYGYETKFRLVPLDFSHIEGDYIYDFEEVAIATKDISFEEYISARLYLLVSDLSFNSRIFQPLIRFLMDNEIKVSTWINHIFSNREKFSNAVNDVFSSFKKDTKGELWDSEEELYAHYSKPEIFEQLIAGDIGGNVLFKHRIWMLTMCEENWVDDVFQVTQELINVDDLSLMSEYNNIHKYVIGTVKNCYTPENVDSIFTESFTYDLTQWMCSESNQPLSNFKTDIPISISFGLSEREISILNDAFNRYGTDLPGLVKLVQRIVSMPYRKPLESTLPNSLDDATPSSVGRISL